MIVVFCGNMLAYRGNERRGELSDASSSLLCQNLEQVIEVNTVNSVAQLVLKHELADKHSCYGLPTVPKMSR